MKFSNAKGTRDFPPETLVKRKYILNIIESVFKKFGFMPLETPALEQLETLTGKYGNEGDKLLFKVINSGDFAAKVDDETWKNKQSEKILRFICEKGLRYDLTVPLARFVASNRNEIVFPFKRYQMQPVWRADRPQRGRYREFWQCDIDTLGTNCLMNEAEIISMAVEIFKTLNLNVTIFINNRKILEAIAEKYQILSEFTRFTNIIDKLDKNDFESLKLDFESLGLSNQQIEELKKILKKYTFDTNGINQLKDIFLTNPKAIAGCNEFYEIYSYLEKSELNEKAVMIDLSLARGLDYYTGCIFEIKSNEETIGSIAGGGRYDNLTEVFGLKDVSGVGVSFGIDRIYDIMEKLKLLNHIRTSDVKVLLCHFDKNGQIYNFQKAAELRNNGISAEVYPDIKKINKQFEYAEKKEIDFVIITGEEEINTGVLTLKNLKHRTQEKLSFENVIERLNF
ncbi:MAG: histidine--tRNA ligase [Bacteroidetes bacterium]|nr:histidine--tRNA ligase [Bacteroidota bacterium]